LATLENVKILLEMDEYDISKDSLLNLYISRAQDFIFDYCKITEIPSSLNSSIEDMAVFQYRQKGAENLQSEGKGSLSESYILQYPQNIMSRLTPYCRVRFI
jgi:hypothetical protein